MRPDNTRNEFQIDEANSPLSVLVASLCGPVLLLLALWFLFGASKTAPVPEAKSPAILASDIDPSPRFVMMSDPPTTVIGGFTMRCNECHGMVDLSSNDGEPLVQHTEIKLNHGLNDRCLSCHDREDRNRLVGRHGNNLAYADVPQLCAQCHGPVYRDWVRGTHGKTLGYWDATKGKQHKLVCSECHDPHSPAYEPMRPLPGPNTLRMGRKDEEFPVHISEERNPLLRWRTGAKTDELDGTDHKQDTTEGGAH